jgi:putative hydrolase of the HAD superfamily
MIKAGIFDVGGVLHDWSDKNVAKEFNSALGIDRKTLKKAYDESIPDLVLGKINETEFWKIFRKSARNIKKKIPKDLLLRPLINYYKIHDDVLDIVKSLRKKDYRVIALSNSILSHANYERQMGIYGQFDFAVLSHEVRMKKPEPEIYKYALERLGVKPEEAFFVDDTKENVEVAERLGIHGILFKNVSLLSEELEKLGVKL